MSEHAAQQIIDAINRTLETCARKDGEDEHLFGRRLTRALAKALDPLPYLPSPAIIWSESEATPVSMGAFAFGLFQCSHEGLGVEEAATKLADRLRANEASGIGVMPVWGVCVESSIDLGDDTSLMPVSELRQA